MCLFLASQSERAILSYNDGILCYDINLFLLSIANKPISDLDSYVVVKKRNSSKIPHCRNRSKIPHCRNRSKIPHCRNSSKIPHCRNRSKIPHCRNSSKIPHCRNRSEIQETKLIYLAHKNMTLTFLAWNNDFNKKWRIKLVYDSFQLFLFVPLN